MNNIVTRERKRTRRSKTSKAVRKTKAPEKMRMKTTPIAFIAEDVTIHPKTTDQLTSGYKVQLAKMGTRELF
jgi:hypothetical protein